MLITYLVIFCSIILLFLKWYQLKKKYWNMIDGFPGPKTTFFLGNTLDLARDPRVMFKRLREFSKKYSTYRIWAWYEPSVHIVTPEDAEKLLSSTVNIQKGFAYRFVHSWFGQGILTSNGEKWRKRRKMLTPTFHFSILQKFADIIAENSENLVLKLEKECQNTKTDVIPLIERNTLNVFCETAMGKKLDDEDETHKNYIESVKKIGNVVAKRLLSPWMYTDFIFYLLPLGKRQNMYLKSIKNFTTQVIAEREKDYLLQKEKTNNNNCKNENIVPENDIGYNGKKKMAMLDLLLEEKIERNAIDDEGIKEEVDTFMFGGHDTTAMALCYQLILLANHPDVQDKIVEEIKEIKGDTNRKLTYNDLQSLRYLDMVIRESIRLYPSISFISREVLEEVKLESSTIPIGALAVVHFYDIHRDPRHFPDPEKFDPERFSPENSKNRHPYSFIPFSAGPRNCIGQKFGMLSMKSVISHVVWNFKLEPVLKTEDLTILYDIIIRHDGPLYVKFVKRLHENQ